MSQLRYEYATVLRYLKPARKDGMTVEYTDPNMQGAVTTEIGKMTAQIAEMCQNFQGGGWYLNSHSINTAPDGVLMISYILQRAIGDNN